MTHYQGSVPDTEPGKKWLLAAACRAEGVDPDLMFPDNNTAGIAIAKSICRPCPVWRECLRDALRTDDNQYGIRGGLRPDERRAVAKELARRQEAKQAKPKPVRKKREPAKCGTRSGYQRHLREKTEICGPCRRANTDADNRLRRTGTTKAAA